MNDGYRYFKQQSPGGHFRVPDNGGFLPTNRRVEVWTGTEWKPSGIQPFIRHIDDVLLSGATVRELLDEKEIPHV